MKQLKTKKRRSSWMHFAIAGAVLVGLSLGISQMVPKSHPIRALRNPGRGLDSASKPIEGFMLPLEGEVDNLQLLCCLKTKCRAVSVPFRCLMSGCMLRFLKKRESAAIKMIW